MLSDRIIPFNVAEAQHTSLGHGYLRIWKSNFCDSSFATCRSDCSIVVVDEFPSMAASRFVPFTTAALLLEVHTVYCALEGSRWLTLVTSVGSSFRTLYGAVITANILNRDNLVAQVE